MNVILLNGPSSAGKSTISHKLQERLLSVGEESVIISIDDHMITDPKETIYEDDIFEIMPGMCHDIKENVINGKTVIVDHAITSERIYQMFLDEVNEAMDVRVKNGLPDGKIITVKVVCDIVILRQREEARGDRCPGSAEASLKYLWPKDGYDLCIDNGTTPVSENVEKIFRALLCKERS